MRIESLPDAFVQEDHNWKQGAFQARAEFDIENSNLKGTIIVSYYDTDEYQVYFYKDDEYGMCYTLIEDGHWTECAAISRCRQLVFKHIKKNVLETFFGGIGEGIFETVYPVEHKDVKKWVDEIPDECGEYIKVGCCTYEFTYRPVAEAVEVDL